MPQVQSVRLAASTPEQEEEAPEGLDKTNTSESIFRLTPMLCRKLTHRCAKGRSSEKSESYYTDPVGVMHGGGTSYSSRQCYAFSKCLSIYNLLGP